MKALERFADARNSVEGKIVAVIMAFVMAFTFSDLYLVTQVAYAADDDSQSAPAAQVQESADAASPAAEDPAANADADVDADASEEAAQPEEPAADLPSKFTTQIDEDAVTYTLTFNLVGGTLTDEQGVAHTGTYVVEVEEGTTLAPPANDPVRLGYEFKGWGSVDFTQTTLADANKEYTAQWEALPAQFTFDFSNGAKDFCPIPDGFTSTAAFTGVTDQAVTARDLPDLSNVAIMQGYVFNGYLIDNETAGIHETGATQLPETYPAGTTTVKADWSPRTDLTYYVYYWSNNVDQYGEPMTRALVERPVRYDNATYRSTVTLSEETLNAYRNAAGYQAGVSSPASLEILSLDKDDPQNGNIFNVYYEPLPGQITFCANNVTEGSATSEETFTVDTHYEQTYTLPTADELPEGFNRYGYVFAGWATERAGTPVQQTTFSVQDLDLTFYATWVADPNTPYKVLTYQQKVVPDAENDYDLIATDETNYYGEWGTVTNVTMPQREGFTLKPIEQQTIAMDGSTEVKAYYDRVVNNVTYEMEPNYNMAGYDFSTKTESYRYGATVTLPEPKSYDGFEFSGWQPTGGVQLDEGANTFTMGANAVRFVGSWTAEPSHIVFETNGGTHDFADPAEGATGDPVPNYNIMPDTSKYGYVFKGWYDNPDFKGEEASAMPSTYPAGTLTYYAKWEPLSNLEVIVQYYVDESDTNKVDLNYQGSYTLYNQVFGTPVNYDNDGGMQNVLNWMKPSASGFDDGYILEDESISTVQSTNASDNIVKVVYTPHMIEMTLDGNAPNAVTGQNEATKIVRVKASSTIQLDQLGSVFTNPGYRPLGWYTAPTGGQQVPAATDYEAGAENFTLYAHWEANTDTNYNIKYLFQNPNDNGYVEQPSLAASLPASGTGTTDTETNVTAPAVEHFTAQPIVQQNIDGTGDAQVTVRYNRVTYTVHYEYADNLEGSNGVKVPESASALPADQQVRHGARIVFPYDNITAPGYVFNGFTCADVQNNTMPTHDVVATGTWSGDKAYIVFESNGGSYVAPREGYAEGAVVNHDSLQNSVRAGYKFEGWYDNAELTGDPITALPATFPPLTTTYYAKWTELTPYQYTVNYYLGSQESNDPYRTDIHENQRMNAQIAVDDALLNKYYRFTDGGNSTIDNSRWYYEGKADRTSLTVTDDNDANVINVVYAAKPATITYIADNETDEQTVIETLAQTRITLPTCDFDYEGYEFDCWQDAYGNTYEVGDPYQLDVDDNAFTAVWTPSGNISYSVVCVDQDGTQLKAATRVGAYPLGQVLTREQMLADGVEQKIDGYTFTGKFDNDTLTIGRRAADNIVTLTYAKRTDLEYTVQYYKQNVTTGAYDLLEQQRFTGQTFGTTVNEVDGLKIAGYSINDQRTVGLPLTVKTNDAQDPAVNVIKVYYDADRTTPYSVNYYLQGFDGNYSLLWTDNRVGVTDTQVSAAIPTYEGYSVPETHPGMVLQGTIAGDGSTVLSVYYNLNKYTVTYEFQGTEIPDIDVPAAKDYYYGDTVTLADEPQHEDFIFSGWRLSEQLQNGRFAMPSHDVTITGVWSVRGQVEYQVEHYLQNADDDDYSLWGEPQTFGGRVGDTVTAAYLSSAGVVSNPDYELTEASGVVSEDETLVLKLYYDRAEYDVAYSYGGNYIPEDATALPGPQTYRFGATVQMPADAQAEGYIFNGWQVNVTVRDGAFIMPANTVQVTGTFSPAPDTQYKVEHYLQNVDDDDYTLDYTENNYAMTGEYVTAVERPATGFTLNTAAADAVASANVQGDGSTVLKLYYDRQTYPVVYKYDATAPQGASSLPADTYYRYGQTVQLADAAEAAGYTFEGWVPNGVSVQDGTFTMPAASVSVVGSFAYADDTPYKIEHFFQNVSGTGYELGQVEELAGTTYASVTAKASDEHGFTVNLSVPGTVSAGSILPDGSTVLRLYYDRNMYNVVITMDGKPVTGGEQTVRFGNNSIAVPLTAPTGSRIDTITTTTDRAQVKAMQPGTTSYTIDAIQGVDRNYAIDAATAEITLVKATAVSRTRNYDGTPLTTYASFEGLKSNEGGIAEISGSQTNVGSSEATVTSVTIITTGGLDTTANYKFEYASGTLTIEPRPITIRVNDAMKQVGTPDPVFDGAILGGLIRMDDLGEITYGRLGTSEELGVYEGEIMAYYTENPNYVVTVIPGALQILMELPTTEGEGADGTGTAAGTTGSTTGGQGIGLPSAPDAAPAAEADAGTGNAFTDFVNAAAEFFGFDTGQEISDDETALAGVDGEGKVKSRSPMAWVGSTIWGPIAGVGLLLLIGFGLWRLIASRRAAAELAAASSSSRYAAAAKRDDDDEE